MKEKLLSVFVVCALLLVGLAAAKTISGTGHFWAEGNGTTEVIDGDGWTWFDGTGLINISDNENITIENNGFDKLGGWVGQDRIVYEGDGEINVSGSPVNLVVDGNGSVRATGTGRVDFVGDGSWGKYKI